MAQHMRNANRESIEHFGYVDGRSQPLMLQEDVEDERDKMGGVHRWDPAFGIGTVLIPRPGGNDEYSFGSYRCL